MIYVGAALAPPVAKCGTENPSPTRCVPFP